MTGGLGPGGSGTWPIKRRVGTVPAGANITVTGVSSRRLEFGKKYYLVCRYGAAKEEIVFDYSVSFMVKKIYPRFAESARLL